MGSQAQQKPNPPYYIQAHSLIFKMWLVEKKCATIFQSNQSHKFHLADNKECAKA